MKNRLREIRKAKGISQAQLFGMTKIWPSSIGFIERNFWDPGLDVKRRLARALRVRIVDLFPDVESKATAGSGRESCGKPATEAAER